MTTEMTFVPALINNAQPSPVYGVPGCCQTQYPNQLCDRCKATTGIQLAVFAHNEYQEALDKVRQWCTCKFGGEPACEKCKKSATVLFNEAQQKETAAMCTNNSDRDDDTLALPTVNWNEPIEPTPNYAGPVTNAGDSDDVLRLPTVNWHEAPDPTPTDGCYHPGDLVVDSPGIAQHELTNNLTPDDDDVLQLPYVVW